MYQELNVAKVKKTIARLNARINDRFPNASLAQIGTELLQFTNLIESKIHGISQKNRWIQGGVWTLILVLLAILIYSFYAFEWTIERPNLAEIIQLTEALINDVVLIGAALFFLFTLDIRLKTKRALEVLHQLRSLAHVIDMHQLTKDPAVTLSHYQQTPNSPKRILSVPELQRYLDYCSEMFSLIGKLAAMFSERLPEPAIVSAANDIENLCTGLSQKVWHKMYFLQD